MRKSVYSYLRIFLRSLKKSSKEIFIFSQVTKEYNHP